MVYTFFKRTGEPLVLIDSAKTTKSLLRLKYYYFNDGYFDVTTKATLDTVKPKQGKSYLINTGPAYVLTLLKLP
jgi:hypothetical protein